jgi:hypothetical protein
MVSGAALGRKYYRGGWKRMNFLIGWGISAIRAAKEFEEAMNRDVPNKMFKAYFHRHGAIRSTTFDSLQEAENFLQHESAMGELFADCITDANDIVIRDYDAETAVFGREQPISRVGKRRESRE